MKVLDLLNLFGVISICFQDVHPSPEQKFFGAKDEIVEGHSILTLYFLTDLECVYECSQRVDCDSINYDDAERICVLVKEVDDGSENIIVPQRGWKYWEKEQRKVNTFYISQHLNGGFFIADNFRFFSRHQHLNSDFMI